MVAVVVKHVVNGGFLMDFGFFAIDGNAGVPTVPGVVVFTRGGKTYELPNQVRCQLRCIRRSDDAAAGPGWLNAMNCITFFSLRQDSFCRFRSDCFAVSGRIAGLHIPVRHIPVQLSSRPRGSRSGASLCLPKLPALDGAEFEAALSENKSIFV